MAKDPAFLFYTSDFLTGTIVFSMEERGQYITILCILHQQGRLTYQEIRAVLRGKKPSENVLKKFKIDEDGKYYNERLESEINKRKLFTESRRNSLDINSGDPVFIYLLYDRESGHYKIGSSKYPLMRLTEIQKKRPQVILFWKTEGLVPRWEEKKLHTHFKPKKIVHDWFALIDSDILFIKEKYRTGNEINNRTDSRTEDDNEIDNEDLNGIKEGGLEETINPDSILEWMVTTFLESNPEYPIDRLTDLLVLKTIGEKIVKWQKSGGMIVLDANRKIIRQKWKELVLHIRSDSHLSKYSLTQINKHFQSVVQSFINGNQSGKTKQNGQYRPVITEGATGSGTF